MGIRQVVDLVLNSKRSSCLSLMISGLLTLCDSMEPTADLECRQRNCFNRARLEIINMRITYLAEVLWVILCGRPSQAVTVRYPGRKRGRGQ